MARVRINKKGEIVLTLSAYEARMTGDALAETIAKHNLGKSSTSATVMRAIDRGLSRAPEVPQQKDGDA
jgi:hypothetical protein